MSTENESTGVSEELRRKTYLAGERLKASGLDPETVYARLEKTGVPEDLAKQVVKDLWTEHKRKVVEEAKEEQNVALIRVALGIGVAVVSYLLFPENFIVPVGFILIGIIAALMARKKINNNE